MHVTPIGYLLLPLGLFLFLRGERALFWTTIWAIPFFEVVPLEFSFAPIRAFQYFGVLLILRHLINRCVRARKKVRLNAVSVTACLFLATVCLSLFMPLLLTDHVYVWPEGARFGTASVPLQFQRSNFTQLLYPLFGVASFFVVKSNIRGVADLKRIIHILLIAFALLAATHVASLIFYVFGTTEIISHFYTIMGASTDINFSAYNAIGQTVRIVTLAGEPGYTGLYYVLAISLIFGLIFGGYHQSWQPHMAKPTLGLAVVLLILNSSTTGYFGFVMLMVGFLVATLFRRSNRVSYSSNVRTILRTLFLAITGLSALVFVANEFFGLALIDFLSNVHLSKITEMTGSGDIRMTSLQYSLKEVFAVSPLLGVGFGSHRALSHIAFLLANVGIIGTATFFAFATTVFWRAFLVIRRSANVNLVSIAFAIVLAAFAVLSTLCVAKSQAALSWLWLLLAMMEGGYLIYLRKKNLPKLQNDQSHQLKHVS